MPLLKKSDNRNTNIDVVTNPERIVIIFIVGYPKTQMPYFVGQQLVEFFV